MRLDSVIKSLSVANAAIKNTASPTMKAGWYPTFSASGQDVWLPNYRFNQKGIVVSAVGARCGKAFKADGKWNVCANTHALSVDESIADRDYCWYLLNNENWWIKGGTAQPFVKVKESLKREFAFPSLAEQRAIVRRLDTIVHILDLKHAELSALDDLVKSRFVEMFGDPVSNSKGWEKCALSEEAEITIGPFGSILHKEDYVTGAHPLVNPSHIIDGKIVPDETLTVSDEKYAELAAYHLQRGDVVMGRRGEMGRCAVVTQSGLLCGTGSLIIRSKGALSADFIQKIISFPSFKRAIEAMAVGQTMPNLNVPIVSAFQIIKPPQTIQHAYYQFVSQIDKSKAMIQQAITEMQTLFDSLMQEFFGKA